MISMLHISEQLMCPLGYSERQSGIGAGLLIFAGLVGSFVLGPIARRTNKHLEVTKVAMPGAALCGISLAISLRFANIYWAILLSLMGFGFFGLGAYPIILELAVEVSIDTEKCPELLQHPCLSPGILSIRPCDI